MNLPACIVVALLSCFTARAWGPDGHQIVGRIAELRLSPAAAKAVAVLLNDSNQLARVSNWADHIRKSRSETAPWHFVDIPFDAEAYDPERDCAAHDGCVVEVIPRFVKVLADREAEPADRVEALKFLVHFVGDIHQPLHCGERNGDKGGNLFQVRWPGESKPVKLHAVWDSNLVQRLVRNEGISAETLNATITREQAIAWSTGTAADWAWESHRLAVEKVYADLPESGAHRLSEDYITAGQAVVREQLAKGGVCLAHLLNFALGN
jgi:hypothetical protein